MIGYKPQHRMSPVLPDTVRLAVLPEIVCKFERPSRLVSEGLVVIERTASPFGVMIDRSADSPSRFASDWFWKTYTSPVTVASDESPLMFRRAAFCPMLSACFPFRLVTAFSPSRLGSALFRLILIEPARVDSERNP